MENKDITVIVILNYNNAEWTIKCIESIEKFNTAPIKYIVIDNGSDAIGEIDRLSVFLSERFCKNYRLISDCEDTSSNLQYATLIKSSTNDGYAKGNNKGLKYAFKDDSISNILILNNDITFVEDIIPSLTFYLKSLPEAGIVSPILFSKTLDIYDYTCARNKSLILEEIFFNICHPFFPKYVEKKLQSRRWLLLKEPQKGEAFQIDLPSGSCMLLDKSIFFKIGAFDPNTFLYWEEQILYEKIKKIGLKNYLCPDLKCIHWGGASTAKLTDSFFTLKCLNESCLYYWREYTDCTKLEYDILKFSISFYMKLRIIRKHLAPIKRFFVKS